MRNRTITYFEGKISQLLARNNINNIHELAIQALHNQNHSDLNEFYLDVAIAKLQVEKYIGSKKVIQKNKSIKTFPLAA